MHLPNSTSFSFLLHEHMLMSALLNMLLFPPHKSELNWSYSKNPSLIRRHTTTHTHTTPLRYFGAEKTQNTAAALYPRWHIDMSHGYMKECQQTEADIPPRLWDKRLTNERSSTITARCVLQPSLMESSLFRGGSQRATRSCTPSNMVTLLNG